MLLRFAAHRLFGTFGDSPVYGAALSVLNERKFRVGKSLRRASVRGVSLV